MNHLVRPQRIGRPLSGNASLNCRIPAALHERLLRDARENEMQPGALVTQALIDWYAFRSDNPTTGLLPPRGSIAPTELYPLEMHPLDARERMRLLKACGWPEKAAQTAIERPRNDEMWASLLVQARLTSGKEELKQWDETDLAILTKLGMLH